MTEGLWCIDGVTLTGENRSTWTESCPTTRLSTTNLTWTGFVVYSPAANKLSRGTVSSLLTVAVSIIKWWEKRIVFGDIERTGDGAILTEKLNKTTDFGFPTEIWSCNVVLYGQSFLKSRSINYK